MPDDENGIGEIKLQLHAPYPPQIEFYKSRARFTAYGGSRGGGKSVAAREKAAMLCLHYAGLQILLLRRTLPELKMNHLYPLQELLNGIAQYKSEDKLFVFPNGSRLFLGYCDSENDVLRYQGQQYDVIFMEEATNFTVFQYQKLLQINRPSGLCKVPFTPRMYLTCNPGGPGHNWVKRLFVDKIYKEKEIPEDYKFIRSSVYDNKFILENDPGYIRNLENLPDAERKAMLYGDWDVFEGQYFSEFDRAIHVIKPFTIPSHWRRYFTMDYGLDMLAGYFIAVDEQNQAYVYREIYQPKLIIRAASQAIKDAMVSDDNREYSLEQITHWYAPTDLWNKRQETGRSVADIFRDNGIYLTRTSNDRVAGWLSFKEWLSPYQDEMGEPCARLRIFENCVNLIRCIPMLQYDNKKSSDVKDIRDIKDDNHEITHAPDAIRYFINGRIRPAPPLPATSIVTSFNWGKKEHTNAFGIGQQATQSYIDY